MSMQAIIDRIKKLTAEYSDDYCWAVRWDAPGLPIGHIFPPSRVWDDGTPTDETLAGTSAIEAKYLSRIKDGYEGVPYIVCGINVAWGQDEGEVVLSECEVMAIP